MQDVVRPEEIEGRLRFTGEYDPLIKGEFSWRYAFDVDDHTEYNWTTTMQMVRARVKNGRLVLDEPTDRPEGEVVELVPLDEVLANGGDYLDDQERAALHAELEASIAEAKAGALIDADVVLAELRSMR